MIIRARSVVTMNGPPIANGAVAITGNQIGDVGEWEAIRRRNSGDVTDLGECALLPGLINAHCHLDYTGLRGKIARRDSFADWIRAINAEKAKLSADDYLRAINHGFAEALRFGTTSIANLTGFPELIPRLKAPMRTWWFAELIDVRDPTRAAKMVEDVRALQRGINFAPHAPYTASPALFQLCVEAAERDNLLLTTHLAESAEEKQMCRDGTGPLADFLKSISPDLLEHSGTTPVAHLSKFCHFDKRWLLVHVNEIVEPELALLGKANIVHCPRSHAYFGHRRFEFQKLRQRGANICLGTDSLASNDDLSLFAEMRQLRKMEPALSGRETLEAATVNPAAAFGWGSALGTLRAGYRADMIAVPFRVHDESVCDEIVDFRGEISWKMIDGTVVTAP